MSYMKKMSISYHSQGKLLALIGDEVGILFGTV